MPGLYVHLEVGLEVLCRFYGVTISKTAIDQIGRLYVRPISLFMSRWNLQLVST